MFSAPSDEVSVVANVPKSMYPSESPHIVAQYVDEASFLIRQRSRATTAANVNLSDLGRIDQRLGAHLTGLRGSPATGSGACDAAIVDEKDWGQLFVALVLALETRDNRRVHDLLSLADDDPSLRPGAMEAFAWVSRDFLPGIVKDLLTAESPFRRIVALRCCAAHQTDPRDALKAAILAENPAVRAEALYVAAELGRLDLRQLCERNVTHPDPRCRSAAVISAVLLDALPPAHESLIEVALTAGPDRDRAFMLALISMSVSDAHRLLQQIRVDFDRPRWLIRGSGFVGDPAYIPWLIQQMDDEPQSRIAGEAFTTITGIELRRGGLHGEKPTEFEAGPNDDADDTDVAIDRDEGLPWPDRRKIEAWWSRNRANFLNGRRYFWGAEVTTESCWNVIASAYQPQRIIAAHQIAMLSPGSTIFNTSGPARRQLRLLADNQRTQSVPIARLADVPE